MNYNELSAHGYKLHHSAIDRGYYSRKAEPSVSEYTGRFGTGYKVRMNNPRSNYYGIAVEYWVKS